MIDAINDAAIVTILNPSKYRLKQMYIIKKIVVSINMFFFILIKITFFDDLSRVQFP